MINQGKYVVARIIGFGLNLAKMHIETCKLIIPDYGTKFDILNSPIFS